MDKDVDAYDQAAVHIDLNADVGEGSADDPAVIAAVSSVNIACGAHAGDVGTIERTIALAMRAGAAVGAHPAYPDREGFGRRALEIADRDLERSLIDQMRVVVAAADRARVRVGHVKPHGALYNLAARDPAVAGVVARAVRAVSDEIVVVGLAGSAGVDAIAATGLRVAAEAFADRRYEPDGRLRDRREPDALLDDPADAAAQAVRLARDGTVVAIDGSVLHVPAVTICVHGDAPGAAGRAVAVRAALEAAGIDLRPFA